VAYQDALKSKLDDLYSTAGAAVSDLSGVVAGADVLASQFADVKNALQDLQDLADGLRSGYAYTPTGVVVPFAGSDANKPPSGWLVCNGASVSTSTYADLFAVIGYGFGGGGANFDLPDLRGRTIVGVGTGAGLSARALAAEVGAETLPEHTHIINDSAGGHTHGITDPGHTHNTGAANATNTSTGGGGTRRYTNLAAADLYTYSSGTNITINSAGAHNHTINSTGTGTHGVMQPSLVLNYIIKA